MNIVPLVTQEEFELARKMEDKFLALPKESGVLFIGVNVEVFHPDQADAIKRNVRYHVVVGMDRSFTVDIVEPLVRVTLGEMGLGLNLLVEAYRGRIRKSA
jgi:hypothetical protein